MRLLELNLSTPAENLAADEAVLEWSESGGDTEFLMFWESTQTFVVVGYANKVADEVDKAQCAAHGIPIYRRCSGGGTVLQAPGVLNYSLILRIEGHHPVETISQANAFIMDHQRQAIQTLLTDTVEVTGCTDLAVNQLKFSGNAQRRKRKFLLFHGTFLLQIDLDAVQTYLRHPTREPGYRSGRQHNQFLTNLNLHAASIKAALARVWSAARQESPIPLDQIRQLAANRYSSSEWNLKF